MKDTPDLQQLWMVGGRTGPHLPKQRDSVKAYLEWGDCHAHVPCGAKKTGNLSAHPGGGMDLCRN